MLDDFRRSVHKILNERLTNPFWGAFIISWLAFNWKIVYLTIFIDQDKITGTKIDYIVVNLIDYWFLFGFPTISAVVLTTIFPFVTTFFFWVSLRFNKWKTDLKNKVEGETLLSLEKSVQIREEIRNINRKYDSLTKESEEEIKILKSEIDQYRKVTNENANLQSSIQDYTQKIKELDQENVTLKNRIENMRRQLENHNTDEETEIDKLAQKIYSKISENELHSIFRGIDDNVYMNPDRESIDRLVTYGVIAKATKHKTEGDLYRFNYTVSGQKIKNHFYNYRF